MRRTRAALLFLAGLGLAACAAALPEPQVVVPATPPPPAELPTYRLGDRWIRSDGLYELVRIENDRYVFALSPRNREITHGHYAVVERVEG